METLNKNQHTSTEVIDQVTSAQLDEIITAGNHIIIDVRSAAGIASQGSIPTAVNIPLDDLKEQLDHRLGNPDSLLNSERPFLFCCTGGVMSYMAAIHARKSGIRKVYNLEGGHSAWKERSAS